eukprot:448307-Ditylum_brightwellii.AAC.1
MVYNTLSLYKGWFDPMLFANTTKPLKVNDILNVVYNGLDEQAHRTIYTDEPDIQYNKDHYQFYKNQYTMYMENIE